MNKPLHFIITAIIIGLPSQATCNLALAKNIASAASIGSGTYGILKLWRTRKDRRSMPRKVAQILASLSLVALGAYGLSNTTSTPRRTTRTPQSASKETEISQITATPPTMPINNTLRPSPEKSPANSAPEILPGHQTPKTKHTLNRTALAAKRQPTKNTQNKPIDAIPFPQLLHTPLPKVATPPREESRSTGLPSVDLSENNAFNESDEIKEPVIVEAITAHVPSVEHRPLPEIVKEVDLGPGYHTPSPRRPIALATQSPAAPSISTSPASISAVPFPGLLTSLKTVPLASPTGSRASAFSRPKSSTLKTRPLPGYTTPVQHRKLKPLTLDSFKIEGFTEAFGKFLHTTGKNQLMAEIFGSTVSSKVTPNAPKVDHKSIASALYSYEIYNKEKQPISDRLNEFNPQFLEEKFNSFQLVSRDEMKFINQTDKPRAFKIKRESGLPEDAYEIVIWLDVIFEGGLSEHDANDILGQKKTMRIDEGPRPYPPYLPNVKRRLDFSSVS